MKIGFRGLSESVSPDNKGFGSKMVSKSKVKQISQPNEKKIISQRSI
jgi:hypothetical protein